MTDLVLPVRVRVSDGAKLPPSGIDPYTLPWVEGAADTLPQPTLDKYAKQHNQLRAVQAAAAKRRKENASGRI